MEEKKNELFEIDIMALLGALWHRLWLIILAMVICAAGTFAYAKYSVTPMYQASTVVYVYNGGVSVGSTKISLSTSDLNAAARLIDTYVIILKTRNTLEKVIEKSGVDLTYDQLNGMIQAASINETEIFRVTVTDSDPKRAQLLANTITKVLPERIENIMETCTVRVVDEAIRPSAPIAPNVSRYTLIGALVGAVISCGIIVLMELFDNQIRGEDYLRQTYPKVNILAAIPDLDTSGNSGYYRSRYYRKKEYKTYQKYGYGAASDRKEDKQDKEAQK